MSREQQALQLLELVESMGLDPTRISEQSEGDLLDMKLESGELNGSPITTDENLSKLFSVSIPGASGETPSSKPYDATGGTGIAESPSGKPYDAMNLSIPSGKEIPEGSYHKMLKDLQGSYQTAKHAFESIAEAALELAAAGAPPQPPFQQT